MRILLFNTVIVLLCIQSFFLNQTENNRTSEKAKTTILDQKTRYTNQQIELFIREVFQDQADILVLKSDSGRLEMMKNFLNRVEVDQRADLRKKEIPLLSVLKLNNKFNSNLKMDTYYNPNTFNPLKYHFNMSSKEIQLYRIDNTDFIIRVLPIN